MKVAHLNLAPSGELLPMEGDATGAHTSQCPAPIELLRSALIVAVGTACWSCHAVNQRVAVIQRTETIACRLDQGSIRVECDDWKRACG